LLPAVHPIIQLRIEMMARCHGAKTINRSPALCNTFLLQLSERVVMMLGGKENRGMSREEMLELMKLKGWSITMLAAQVRGVEETIYRWLKAGAPDKAESILMRMWLEEEQSKLKNQSPSKAKLARAH